PYEAAASVIINAEGASAFEELLESGRVRELTAPEDRRNGYVGSVIPAVDYIKALRLRGVAARALDEALAGVDCYVAPTLSAVTYPIGKPFEDAWPEPELPPGTKQPRNSGAAQNLVGLPGIAAPNGFGKEGLPTSICFTGRAFRELAVIEAARGFQERTDWHRRRAPTA